MTEDMQSSFPQFTAEHAWRMIFADEQETEVPPLRPRIVDPEELHGEREQWSRQHEQQALAEQEMAETRDN